MNVEKIAKEILSAKIKRRVDYNQGLLLSIGTDLPMRPSIDDAMKISKSLPSKLSSEMKKLVAVMKKEDLPIKDSEILDKIYLGGNSDRTIYAYGEFKIIPDNVTDRDWQRKAFEIAKKKGYSQ